MTSFTVITPVYDRLTEKSLAVQQDASPAQYLYGLSRNEILAQATGRYVWFLGAGDCLPDAFTLRDVTRELVSHFMPDILYGDARCAGRIIRAKDADYLTRGMMTHPGAVLYSRDLLQKLNENDGDAYRYARDYAALVRAVLATPRLHAFDRILCDARNKERSPDEQAARRAEMFRIRARLLHVPDWKNRIIDFCEGLRDQFGK